MLWEVEIKPAGRDAERERVAADFNRLTHSTHGARLVEGSSHGFLLDADLPGDGERTRLTELLSDRLVENASLGPLNGSGQSAAVTVLLKPGVMDPVAQSVLDAARDSGLAVRAVRTFRRYRVAPDAPPEYRDVLFRKVLANDAIEQVVTGPLPADVLRLGRTYEFRKITVPIRDLNDAALEQLSCDGQLALTLDEMRAIQSHFRGQGRDPTDVELETLAQTWSEHCSHKTLKGRIECDDGTTYDNLLKETIFAATQEVRRRLGADDWCVSVVEDNPGVVKFDDRYHLCF